MLEILIAAALAGASAKVADDYADKNFKIAPSIAISLSFFYGAILGYLAATTTLASLFLALAFANILAQKIDKIHLFGLVSFAAMIFYFGISYFDPSIFSIFLVFGLLDELGLRRPKIIFSLFEHRLSTPIAALFISLYYSEPLFFLTIVSFDVAYKLSSFLISKKLKK